MNNQPRYKDRLFNFLFGSEENKTWTLSLYNAVNGTNYDDPSAIENERYINERRLNKYGHLVLSLPVPKLVVFYNGATDEPGRKFLRLSEAFQEGSASDIEVRVRMLNINYGHSREILEACRPLWEYSWFVEKVRTLHRTSPANTHNIIDQALSEMPDDFVIKPFLKAHQAEVKGMLLTEYNETEAMELFRRDGATEERTAVIRNLLRKYTPKEILEIMDRYSLEEILAVQKKMSEE